MIFREKESEIKEADNVWLISCVLYYLQAFAAMKIVENSEEEEQCAAEEEEDTDGFIGELKTIHKRKMMMQQRLESFHSRQSMHVARETEWHVDYD